MSAEQSTFLPGASESARPNRAILLAESWDGDLAGSPQLAQWLEAHRIGAVTVMSPPVVGAVEWLTGDTHGRQLDARRRLEAADAALRGLGLEVDSSRSDDDPVASVAATLEGHESRVLVVRDRDDSDNWRQYDLPRRLNEQLGIEVDLLELASPGRDAPGASIDDRTGEIPEPNEPA